MQRPVELVAFDDREDYVVARLRDADGGLRECEARFLAGCDGASSTVRQKLGAGFPGGTYDHIFMSPTSRRPVSRPTARCTSGSRHPISC